MAIFVTDRDPTCWQEVSGWLDDREGEFLQSLVRDRDVLEIGSYQGRSTCAMARTARSIIALDWHHGDQAVGDQNTEYLFRRNLAILDLRDVVHPLVMRVERARFAENQFDVVFIDGAHDEASVKRDTLLALGCVRKGGRIVWHDRKDAVLGWTAAGVEGVEDGPGSLAYLRV